MGVPTVRGSWPLFLAAALVLGDGAAVLVLPLSLTVALALFGAVIGATLAGVRCLESFPDRPPVPSGRRLPLIGKAVSLSAIACVAAAGLIAVFGFVGFAVLVTLVALSPPVRARLTSSSERRPDEVTPAELCRQWKITQRKLTQPAFRTVVAALADARAGILDELERRDPRAFAAWLASDPIGAGDPHPFFVTDGDTQPTPGDAT